MGFTYDDIFHLNSKLREMDLPYRINYKDESVAGIEGLGICACTGKEELIKKTVRDFFAARSIMVRFSDDGLTVNVMKSIRVAAAIIAGSGENSGKILAAQRGYGKYKGSWEFPGGKIEEGESPREALIREVREELEVEIEPGELFETVSFDYPEFHLELMCYVAEIKSGAITLIEHNDARWLSPEHLDDVKWLEADRAVIEKLRNSFFS